MMDCRRAEWRESEASYGAEGQVVSGCGFELAVWCMRDSSGKPLQPTHRLEAAPELGKADGDLGCETEGDARLLQAQGKGTSLERVGSARSTF